MKQVVFLILAFTFGNLAMFAGPEKLEQIASFKGQQVTGVTVTQEGRIFVNFPRWRKSVENSVLEVREDGSSQPYPNKEWNNWKTGKPVPDSMFVAVQSVVAVNDKLYVLDTCNPLWKGVINNPRIFVFDLKTDELSDVLILSDDSFKPNTYTNDLRIDTKNGFIYITDSNEPGLIVYDLEKKTSRRALDNHYSTRGEFNSLTINGRKWGGNKVHSDGIAFHLNNDRLYYHALTGYTLYSVSAEALRDGTKTEIEQSVIREAKTPAPDGMIFDQRGNLYMADLENTAVIVLKPNGKTQTMAQGDQVGWADTFSIYDGYLYFTDSKIHLAGKGAEKLNYTINRICIK
ncbi:L-dopachrome tautomerase-related protein [Marinilabilia rubra]|uniref:Major royal jelly protein n=1 Tax=Marinilabilia rubra TaxID=2162893 RepID=A0A2U2BCM6_9BACT|nr:L-dopachrome tautomerase-related protein [Marinilabilia rubra]PWE00811.1 hypothetical protein DDZ16_04255 [Marinilabilia rubra]